MEGLLSIAEAIRQWLYGQDLFYSLDYWLSQPTYDATGILLMLGLIVIGLIVVLILK